MEAWSATMEGFIHAKSFQAELGAAAALVRLHMQTGMAVNADRILRKIQKEQDIIFECETAGGSKNVFENPVSIITGGPGRGKTTVIRFIIAAQEALDKNAVILLYVHLQASPEGECGNVQSIQQ